MKKTYYKEAQDVVHYSSWYNLMYDAKREQ